MATTAVIRNLTRHYDSAAAVQVVLGQLREERGDKLTVTVQRREIRELLRESEEDADAGTRRTVSFHGPTLIANMKNCDTTI